MTIQELIKLIDADTDTSLNQNIEKLSALPEKAQEDELAIIFDARINKVKKKLASCQAKVIILDNKVKEEAYVQEYKNNNPTCSFLFVNRPRYALKQVLDIISKPRYYSATGVHPSAVIDPSAKVDPNASIGAFVYIGPKAKVGANTKIQSRVSIGAEVSIGNDCIIYSGVVIEDYCQISNRVIIHANSVIGSDGYSFVTKEASNLEKLQSGNFSFNMGRQIQEKIQSAGIVIIEDDVEIGSNTSIDRGTINPTIIGAGSKIDNLCQIAHNVEIGKDCLIIANVGIAGSCKIGDRATLAGGAGCGNGVNIGNDAVVGAFSGVHSDVPPFLPVFGIPAVPHGEFMKRQKYIARLEKYHNDIKEIKERISK